MGSVVHDRVDSASAMATGPHPGPVPARPRQGTIWWSAAPPPEPEDNDKVKIISVGVSDEQLREWLSCTAGWRALELTWGALQSCEVRYHQLKPLLQAALAEAARMGAERLIVRQLDVDEVVGRWCLALALSAFPNFKFLKLRELNLYDEAMGHLSGALHASEHLQRLVLDSVWASAGGWSALAAAIKVNTSMRTLRVRHCLAPGGPALLALCAAVADQRGRLEELRLSHNQLGNAGVGELCKALSPGLVQPAGRPSHLAHLDLSYNSVDGQSVPAVAAMLRATRSLRHLNLSHNDLGAEGARELCRALSYAPHLTSLHLAATGADDSTVEVLCRALSATSASSATAAVTGAAAIAGPSGLAAICLAHNRITHKGAALLAAAARRPGCGLADVDLAGNGQVGEAGARAWAEALSSPAGSSRLRRLVLSSCEVPDGGAYALGAALKTNTCLQELGLAENHISTSGLALLAEMVKVNCSLQLLDVSLNMVGPQGMTPFSQMSHLRGHVLFSKARDHTLQRISSCIVKRELLREYRAVEAVKHSSEPWERDRLAKNPFLNPEAAAAAAAGTGAWGGGGAPATWSHTGSGTDKYVNPFLSPTASYVNPFLEAPPPAPGPEGSVDGGHSNPFLADLGSPGGNPFRSSTGPPAHINPFLSDLKVESDGRDGAGSGEKEGGLSGDMAVVAAAAVRSVDGVAGRELVTRVVARVGGPSRHSVSLAAGDEEGGGAGAATSEERDAACNGSGSGTGVYVSSRSTADEEDLVTDLDLRLVDYMMQSLGVSTALAGGNPGSEPPAQRLSPAQQRQHIPSFGMSYGDADVNDDGDDTGAERPGPGPPTDTAFGEDSAEEGSSPESVANPEAHKGWHERPEPYDPDDTGAHNPFL